MCLISSLLVTLNIRWMTLPRLWTLLRSLVRASSQRLVLRACMPALHGAQDQYTCSTLLGIDWDVCHVWAAGHVGMCPTQKPGDACTGHPARCCPEFMEQWYVHPAQHAVSMYHSPGSRACTPARRSGTQQQRRRLSRRGTRAAHAVDALHGTLCCTWRHASATGTRECC